MKQFNNIQSILRMTEQKVSSC